MPRKIIPTKQERKGRRRNGQTLVLLSFIKARHNHRVSHLVEICLLNFIVTRPLQTLRMDPKVRNVILLLLARREVMKTAKPALRMIRAARMRLLFASVRNLLLLEIVRCHVASSLINHRMVTPKTRMRNKCPLYGPKPYVCITIACFYGWTSPR